MTANTVLSKASVQNLRVNLPGTDPDHSLGSAQAEQDTVRLAMAGQQQHRGLKVMLRLLVLLHPNCLPQYTVQLSGQVLWSLE